MFFPGPTVENLCVFHRAWAAASGAPPPPVGTVIGIGQARFFFRMAAAQVGVIKRLDWAPTN